VSIIEIVRRHVGRRHRISRAEMAAILTEAEGAGADLYCYRERPEEESPADWWVSMCSRNTCVSMIDGEARYDEPGSLHPLQMADVTFVPATLRPDSIDYMRQHARRTLLVIDRPDD
jgi:hypothetical protein